MAMAELERLRAVANEINKWEAREKRLAQQIDELHAQVVGNNQLITSAWKVFS